MSKINRDINCVPVTSVDLQMAYCVSNYPDERLLSTAADITRGHARSEVASCGAAIWVRTGTHCGRYGFDVGFKRTPVVLRAVSKS